MFTFAFFRFDKWTRTFRCANLCRAILVVFGFSTEVLPSSLPSGLSSSSSLVSSPSSPSLSSLRPLHPLLRLFPLLLSFRPRFQPHLHSALRWGLMLNKKDDTTQRQMSLDLWTEVTCSQRIGQLINQGVAFGCSRLLSLLPLFGAFGFRLLWGDGSRPPVLLSKHSCAIFYLLVIFVVAHASDVCPRTGRLCPFIFKKLVFSVSFGVLGQSFRHQLK